ncbi:MAG: hypothetical protein QG619_785, partial [Pseudomonadota bacterium]|nr:hypothetical protein [Pseudomonadota bacterium]
MIPAGIDDQLPAAPDAFHQATQVKDVGDVRICRQRR